MKVSLLEARLAHTRLSVGRRRGVRGTAGSGAGVGIEQACDDIGGCAVVRRVAVHGTDGRHAFLVAFLAFAGPDGFDGRCGLDHRYAFAVDHPDKDLADGYGPAALRVEPGEVNRGIYDDPFGAAFGYGHAGGGGNQRDRFVERAAHTGSYETPGDLVAVSPCRQLEFGVEGVDAGLAAGAVPDAGDHDRTEQGDELAGMGSFVRQQDRAALGVKDDRGADVAVTAVVDVGLDHESDHFTAAPFGFAFNFGKSCTGG